MPDFGGNMLSIGRIVEKGYKIEFAHGQAIILSENNEIVLRATRKGRFYIVEKDQPVAYISKMTVNELWHSRLGHLCQSALSPTSG